MPRAGAARYREKSHQFQFHQLPTLGRFVTGFGERLRLLTLLQVAILARIQFYSLPYQQYAALISSMEGRE